MIRCPFFYADGRREVRTLSKRQCRPGDVFITKDMPHVTETFEANPAEWERDFECAIARTFCCYEFSNEPRFRFLERGMPVDAGRMGHDKRGAE